MKLDDFNFDYLNDGSVSDCDALVMARELIEAQLKNTVRNMAAYMISQGCHYTSSGNCIFYFSDLSQKFNVSTEWIKAHEDSIESEIRSYSQVMDDGDGVWIYDEDKDRCFDLNFFLDFCGINGE